MYAWTVEVASMFEIMSPWLDSCRGGGIDSSSLFVRSMTVFMIAEVLEVDLVSPAFCSAVKHNS